MSRRDAALPRPIAPSPGQRSEPRPWRPYVEAARRKVRIAAHHQQVLASLYRPGLDGDPENRMASSADMPRGSGPRTPAVWPAPVALRHRLHTPLRPSR